MATIREATTDEADLRALIALGAEMHPASNFAHLEFNARHFGLFLVDLIAGPAHVVFVAEVDGEMVGAVLASAVPASISPELVACEHALFVTPEHRASGAAQGLIEAYLEWAEHMGVKRVTAGNSAGMDDSRYVRLMQRHGFERAGSLMYMTK